MPHPFNRSIRCSSTFRAMAELSCSLGHRCFTVTFACRECGATPASTPCSRSLPIGPPADYIEIARHRPVLLLVHRRLPLGRSVATVSQRSPGCCVVTRTVPTLCRRRLTVVWSLLQLRRFCHQPAATAVVMRFMNLPLCWI